MKTWIVSYKLTKKPGVIWAEEYTTKTSIGALMLFMGEIATGALDIENFEMIKGLSVKEKEA